MKSQACVSASQVCRAAAWLLCALAAAGCSQDVPAQSAFASADGAAADGAALGSDAAAGAADTAAGAADSAAGDATGSPAGPSCQQALDCLIAAKQWQPGTPPPQLAACTKGMVAAERDEMDGLLGCIDLHCAKELDTWDKGGAAELPALQLCLSGKCPLAVSVCLGGHGAENCAKAIQCMASCLPTDQACNATCLAPTSDAAAAKAGQFFACVFASGCTPQTMATCTIPLSCGLKCPELAGG